MIIYLDEEYSDINLITRSRIPFGTNDQLFGLKIFNFLHLQTSQYVGKHQTLCRAMFVQLLEFIMLETIRKRVNYLVFSNGLVFVQYFLVFSQYLCSICWALFIKLQEFIMLETIRKWVNYLVFSNGSVFVQYLFSISLVFVQYFLSICLVFPQYLCSIFLAMFIKLLEFIKLETIRKWVNCLVFSNGLVFVQHLFNISLVFVQSLFGIDLLFVQYLFSIS